MGFSVLLSPENRETGRKLGIATGLMFTLPFIAFYIAMLIFADSKYPENWAGGAAILTTNLVIGGYCYVAYIEDSDENDENGPKKGLRNKELTSWEMHPSEQYLEQLVPEESSDSM
eukprot:CAMPEP_0201230966 /NCGR_PEP_ID=MMETSP0852-20130820/2617_1 /ASSEMBLY_ACC=CAM_ASM_000632 /TAXON_ID=183588 /ORGANISM="Pseudo-nitzschia fraudulenta, Strain WWA7" /LENGTH=115 /DNA_ID=CAMNT_0047522367 /DNA_START=241 /DNA_END=586 /DNA_ORIENTATION=-